jgi:hypothetical protein
MVCSVCGSTRHNKKTCSYKISISYYRNLIHTWSYDVDRYSRHELRIVGRCIWLRRMDLKWSIHWSGKRQMYRDPIERMSCAALVRYIKNNQHLIRWPRRYRDVCYCCGYNTHEKSIHIVNFSRLTVREQYFNLPTTLDNMENIRKFLKEYK